MSANLRQLRLARRFHQYLIRMDCQVSEEAATRLWIKIFARRFHENQKRRGRVV